MACADCGRHLPDEKMTREDRWPYGNGIPPERRKGISLPVCVDRDMCAKQVQRRRMSIFLSACQGTGSLSAGKRGEYLVPLIEFR